MAQDITRKVADFFAQYPLRSFEKRQIIIRAEEPIEHVFYLLEGRVSQYDITQAGNEVVVNVFKPGAFFPMSAALNKTENYYYFESSTPTKIRLAPAEAVVQFLHENPDVTLDLLTRVYRGVDGVLRRMAHLMGGGAEARLLFELLNAAYRLGETQPDGSIRLALNESDLARQSGLARETVNRHIQTFKAQNLLEVTHTGLVIKSTGRLEAMLGNKL